MQRYEVAVIPIPSKLLSKISVLAGCAESIKNAPTAIFEETRIEFLSELSRRLLTNIVAQSLPDVVTFAFWCRSANLKKIRNSYSQATGLRMGLGLTFHICPANVPINFAFSLAFGLLSGNTCVLRLPSKTSQTTDVVVSEIAKLLEESKFQDMRQTLALLRYERDDEINQYWVSVADGRVVWGGDETVQQMRKFPSKSRSREVAFADRYSICVIRAGSVIQMNESKFHQFCNDLFNDIYLMDQAACSSPQLVAWIGTHEEINIAQLRLWPKVVKIAEKKYPIKAVNVADKFVQACLSSIHNPQVNGIERSGNLLYRIDLSSIHLQQDACRAYFGTVHEIKLQHLNELAPIINERYQTLAIEGIETDLVSEWIQCNHLRGIDRVVPVGRALDMDIVWDGYDIVHSLSRMITI